MTIVVAPLLRVKLDESVDPHDRHAGLDGTLELLHFTHAGLEHTSLQAVVHAALGQVEAVVAVALGLGDGLGVGVRGGLGLLRRRGRVAVGGCRLGGRVRDGVRGALRQGVARAQLCDEVRRVFGGVDGEGGGDCEEGGSEGCDGELLS